MESMTSFSSVSAPREASHNDELFMQRRLLFADSLKDLKNLRKQLYSAAEYFEVSYGNEGQKDMMMEMMKDYAIKSFINTVDHLGSVAYKINSFLDEKIGDVPETELRITCIEQRLQTCREFIDQGGLFQQSLALNYPKHHERYTFPVGETISSFGQAKSPYQTSNSWAEEDSRHFDSGITKETPSELVRNRYSTFESPPQSSSGPRTFHFTSIMSRKVSGKRAASPHRFPLIHAGSLVKRSTSPSPDKRRYTSAPRRSASVSIHAERERAYEIQSYSNKSNNFLKALRSMHKSRKDGM